MANLLNIRQDIEMLERAPVDRWRGEYVLNLLSSMADRIEQLERDQKKLVTITKEQAQEIVSAHEISMHEGDEETELLDTNNPELAEAYRALLAMAEA